ELGVAPGEDARAVKPAPAPAPRAAPRLPHSLTRFFGRERDLAALEEHFVARRDRLVTLTGPGGAGKTRLALAAARRLAPAFAGAAVFVPLEHLGHAAEIPRAILDALGVEPEPGVEARERAAEA